jgi:hypothetical protein
LWGWRLGCKFIGIITGDIANRPVNLRIKKIVSSLRQAGIKQVIEMFGEKDVLENSTRAFQSLEI